MAITSSKVGVWVLDDAYKKIASDYWTYNVFQDPGSYLLSWGNNYMGIMGVNTSINYSSPIQIPGSNWADLYDNNVARYLLKQDNTLWVSGRNFQGGFGLNFSTACCLSSPVQIPGTTWSKLSTNNSTSQTTGAIKTDGTLWVWGQNDFGQLGDVTTSHRSSPVQVPGTTWCNFSFGSRHILALKTDCTLWSWGRNEVGQLGQSTSYSNYRSSPVQVPGTTWCKVSSNGSVSIALKTDGTLWSWGYNGDGGLGDGTTIRRSSPVQLPGTTWCCIHAGYSNAAALKTDNTLWGWGFNGVGGLGDGTITSRSSPIQIPGSWCKLAVLSYFNGGALRTDNSFYVWGQGSNGKLNNNLNPSTNTSSPIQVPGTWSNIKSGNYNFNVFKCTT